MKNLKSKEDHKRLFDELITGKAKVITYGMTDENFNYFAKDFLSADNVVANFDSDKKKWGQKLSMGVVTMSLDSLFETSKKIDGIIIMSGAVFQIGVYLETLGLSYYCGRIISERLLMEWEEKTQVIRDKFKKNEDKLRQVRSLLTNKRSLKIYDSLIAAKSTDILKERFSLISEIVTNDQQYFPEKAPPFLPLSDEVFIDGGAFDGDTIRRLMKLGKEKRVYKHIYAF